MLSEIYPGDPPKRGPTYWDQIREVSIISVTRRVLQRLHDFLEVEQVGVLRINIKARTFKFLMWHMFIVLPDGLNMVPLVRKNNFFNQY